MRHALRRLPRLIVAVMFMVAVVDSESKAATLEESLVDGWNAWRVQASDSRSTRCCYHWSVGQSTMKACDLDGRRSVSIQRDELQPYTGEMQVYALIESGRAARFLRCPRNAR